MQFTSKIKVNHALALKEQYLQSTKEKQKKKKKEKIDAETTWRECDMRKLEGENFRSILHVIKETVIKKPFLNIFFVHL